MCFNKPPRHWDKHAEGLTSHWRLWIVSFYILVIGMTMKLVLLLMIGDGPYAYESNE